MKLNLKLTKREAEALRAIVLRVGVDANVLISETGDRSQMKIGYQLEEGVAVIQEILKLAEQ